ncbi:hypothetical protein BVG16_09815 [Paenibacillus selenitireducens]|uniref:Uncharacterized protein n=1 Tax=Paenibacillus selenitireducens TaxID=1324314 RepID=A0A1T2XHK3_9BACL|nr:hypothetical protein [Paenibacillus selenitireducens]OPA79369.1 hypothetical protein BVG16_09815 [Paenibacillus selenitireducens]
MTLSEMYVKEQLTVFHQQDIDKRDRSGYYLHRKAIQSAARLRKQSLLGFLRKSRLLFHNRT